MSKTAFKHWLAKHELSGNQAAELLLVDKATISRWVNGISAIPPIVTLAIETIERRWAASDYTTQHWAQ